MEEHVGQTSQKVDRAESHLTAQTKLSPPVYTAFEPALTKFRDASQDLFFLSLQEIESKDVENRLWAGHLKVHKLFKDQLASLRSQENRKKTVERRKAEKLYMDFIKSAQRFYRGHIQRVCSHFQGIPEINAVARKMHLDTTSADALVQLDMDQRQQLVESCYKALIQCGDLSRYREVELGHKERNWGPAKGYYECAAELDPSSGHTFNQLSVMARVDEDRFRTLYYIYRGLAMPKRVLDIKRNLTSEFKKLNKPFLPAKLDTKLGYSEAPFLRLHARSYADDTFSEFQAQTDDFLPKLSTIIASQPCNASLRKLCIINIAATKHALETARDPLQGDANSAAEAWIRLQSLNLGVFDVLLHLLMEELLVITTSIGGRLLDVPASIARLTPVCRRVLPCLRLYSAWLLSDLGVIHKTAATGDTLKLQDFWSRYADCLSYLSELFPLAEILDVPYLLEEEQDTVHFTPFNERARRFLHYDDQGGLKPTRDQCNALLVADAQRPDMEMLFRIKGLLKIGAHLVRHPNEFGPIAVPIIFEDNQFEYRPVDHTAESNILPPGAVLDEHKTEGAAIEPEGRVARTTTDNMLDMVDDLVGAESILLRARSPPQLCGFGSYEDSSKENSRPVSGTFTATDLVRQISQGSPARIFSTPMRDHRPTFGFAQDPFAPLPGELGGSISGSRPSTSHQAMSPRLGSHRLSGFFNDDIAKRKKLIDERSSPLLSMEPSTVSNTPGDLHTFAQNQSRPSLQQDQWHSPFASSGNDHETSRKQATPSRFGAIGDSRPTAARSPTSGQSG